MYGLSRQLCHGCEGVGAAFRCRHPENGSSIVNSLSGLCPAHRRDHYGPRQVTTSDNPEAGATPGTPDAADTHHQPLHRRTRGLWVAVTVTFVGVVAAAASVGLAAVDRPWWPVLPATPPAALAAAGWAHWEWRRWWWGTGAEALEVGHGVVIRRSSYVPYHRIQQIDVERGPVERLLGLASLTVHTASATTDASIPGLAVDDARALRRHLLEQAGRDDGV